MSGYGLVAIYIADDPELAEQSSRAGGLIHQLNMSEPNDLATHRAILTELLAALGEGSEIRPPFYFDYGYQTSIGALLPELGSGLAGCGDGDHWRRRPDRSERSVADRHASDQSGLRLEKWEAP